MGIEMALMHALSISKYCSDEWDHYAQRKFFSSVFLENVDLFQINIGWVRDMQRDHK